MSHEAKLTGTEKKTISATNVVYNVLLAVSAVLSIQFVYHISQMANHLVWHGEQYAVQTYGAALALIVSIYIWAKGQTGYQRYFAAVLISVLVVGYAAYLLGKTGVAGRYFLQNQGQ